MSEWILEAKALSRGYQQGDSTIEVLKSLDLQVAKGETIAIVGRSGSGKSTLLSLLAGLDSPDQGQIIIKDSDISRISEDELARFRSEHISIIFQQFHLFKHFTALENVMVPLWIRGKPDWEAAAKALQEVGLQDRGQHYPAQLSGGEKQRVAIARALVSQPDILFADEPSGNLDEQTGRQVIELLFRLVREKQATLILVTHDDWASSHCGRRLRLLAGQLKDEAGT